MGFIRLYNRAVLTLVIELMRTGVFLYVLSPVHPVLPPSQSLSFSGYLLLFCSRIMCWFSTRLVCSIRRDLCYLKLPYSLKELLHTASPIHHVT